MERDRWAQIETLYHAALAHPEKARAAYLAQACTDETLRRDVEALLAQPEPILDWSAAPVVAALRIAADAARLTGRRLGSYHVHERLGAGGMGEVYRARDTKLGRDVALKVLPSQFTTDAERLARFGREARVLASLNNPHIAAIYGLEDADGIHALVLELVPGETLAERIRRGPVALAEALTIAFQIAEALDAAHERGIIHRDLKPANIKITRDGVVKVLDFGLAKAIVDSDPGPDSTQAPTVSVERTEQGVVLGTAAYMSPEQARGLPVDKRADVWAFGCLLYEMLTGRAVFEGNGFAEILGEVLKAAPDFNRLPPETPEGIRRLLRRCLQKDRQHRLHHMADARIEIEEAKTGSQLEDPVAGRSFHRRTAVLIALGAVATLIAAATMLRAPAAMRTPLWVSIVAPTGRLSVVPEFAMSPDGTRVVVAAENPSGTDSLWLRSLDRPDLRELPGTQGGFLPFWSPDGRSIGFFSDGKLQRLDIDGGEPQVLAQAANPRGATWSSRGTIVFSPSPRGGLFSIPASSGPATRLNISTTSDASPWPVFLPDGNHYLFLRGTVDSGELYVATLGSVETKRIADISSKAEYANGYLVYGKDADLFAQRFDLDKLELTGQPQRIASGLGWSYGDNRSRAFSTSVNGTLAFSSQFYLPTTQLTWFDRLGRRLEPTGDPGEYMGLTPAPDGKKVALEKLNRRRGGQDLWVLDVASGIPSRLTSDDFVTTPAWAPDSERIAYWNGAGQIGYKVVTLKGRAPEPLPLRPEPTFLQGWSPDGRLLLASASGDGTQSDLATIRPDSDGAWTPFSRTPFNEFLGRISPDGHWIAYSDDSTGQMEVYVESFPEPGRKQPISRNGGAFPEWRSDGKELYYLAPTSPRRGKLMAVRVAVTASTFAVASPPEALFETQALGDNARRSQYAPFGTGDRFLLNTLVEEAQPRSLTVIVNWPTIVKQQAQ